MNLSIIIPCFNSEKYILKNIEKLKKYKRKKNYKYEIIIIDDCSSDKTFKILKKFKIKNKNIKIYKNSFNEGKSYSLIRGIKKTKYEKIIIIDSDLPYFSKLNIVIRRLKNYDFVLINRGHKKSKNIGKESSAYQIIRSLIGYVVNLIIRISFSIEIKDTQAGLKGFIKPKNFCNILEKNKLEKSFAESDLIAFRIFIVLFYTNLKIFKSVFIHVFLRKLISAIN